ncbi:unnamed protein product [Gordionus sp. m RMFG-2023]|uniref:uncharacterized protein LOC135923824 n=1 Tax=Gordionus sp. m RMFG-2023 TaxID=3053472 RepID=UPI0030DFBDC2
MSKPNSAIGLSIIITFSIMPIIFGFHSPTKNASNNGNILISKLSHRNNAASTTERAHPKPFLGNILRLPGIQNNTILPVNYKFVDDHVDNQYSLVSAYNLTHIYSNKNSDLEALNGSSFLERIDIEQDIFYATKMAVTDFDSSTVEKTYVVNGEKVSPISLHFINIPPYLTAKLVMSFQKLKIMGIPPPSYSDFSKPQEGPLSSQDGVPRHVPSKTMYIDGDIMIGALFSMHHQPQDSSSRQCGEIWEQYGIQRLEAAARAVEMINEDPSILPDIKLGIEVRDSCWYSSIALGQTIEFIRDQISVTSTNSVDYAEEPLVSNYVNGESKPGVAESKRADIPFLNEAEKVKNSDELLTRNSVNGSIFAINNPTKGSLIIANSVNPARDSLNIVKKFGKSKVSTSDLILGASHSTKLPPRITTTTKRRRQKGKTNKTKSSSFKGNSSKKKNVLTSDVLPPLFVTEASLIPKARERKPKYKNIAGIIGPGSSAVAIQVQNLLQTFNIPQIDFSTSKDLSNKKMFKTYMRVVPSDEYQAQVMVDILKLNGWSYIAAINTEGNYGTSGMTAFKTRAKLADLCIAFEDSAFNSAEQKDFDRIVLEISSIPRINVIVCFCEGITVRGLIIATKKLELIGKYVFIGSDGWADRDDVVKDYEIEALGGLSVRINSPYVKDFDPYYFSLKPGSNTRNVWFKELWEFKFSCSLTETQNKCSENLSLIQDYKQDTKLAFVINAVYTIAHGLSQMHKIECGGLPGLCPVMKPINGSLLLEYLLNVTFKGVNGEIINFDENGDPPAKYDIVNYQRIGANRFGYTQIGDWKNNTLTFSTVKYKPPSDYNGTTVKSICSDACGKGFIKSIKKGGLTCCWECRECKPNEFVIDELTCKTCQMGYWPDFNRTMCLKVPERYVRWNDLASIIALTMATLGGTLTSLVLIVFTKHNNTPVIKSSTRELMYVILVGIIISLSTSIPLSTKPNRVSCAMNRIMPGFAFSMIYSALVTKTNRISRILEGAKSKDHIITHKPKFMSLWAQLVITLFLVAIEIVILITMTIWEPPGTKLQYAAITSSGDVSKNVEIICATSNIAIMVPLSYNFFLIGLCTLYAVKTRNLPENFNEAKFIGFCMYTTCVIWIAFVPVYFGSDSKAISYNFCVILSAYVALVFLFFPKLYIIMFRPEKNSRMAFITSKTLRYHFGGNPVTQSVSKSEDETPKYNLYGGTKNPRASIKFAIKKERSSSSSGYTGAIKKSETSKGFLTFNIKLGKKRIFGPKELRLKSSGKIRKSLAKPKKRSSIDLTKRKKLSINQQNFGHISSSVIDSHVIPTIVRKYRASISYLQPRTAHVTNGVENDAVHTTRKIKLYSSLLSLDSNTRHFYEPDKWEPNMNHVNVSNDLNSTLKTIYRRNSLKPAQKNLTEYNEEEFTAEDNNLEKKIVNKGDSSKGSDYSENIRGEGRLKTSYKDTSSTLYSRELMEELREEFGGVARKYCPRKDDGTIGKIKWPKRISSLRYDDSDVIEAISKDRFDINLYCDYGKTVAEFKSTKNLSSRSGTNINGSVKVVNKGCQTETHKWVAFLLNMWVKDKNNDKNDDFELFKEMEGKRKSRKRKKKLKNYPSVLPIYDTSIFTANYRSQTSPENSVKNHANVSVTTNGGNLSGEKSTGHHTNSSPEPNILEIEQLVEPYKTIHISVKIPELNITRI